MKKGPTVLVVEDDRVAALALGRVLESDGYRVLSADSTEKAIAHLQAPVDIVLCDLRLGTGNGLELLETWRQHRPTLPFVLMTAYAEVATAVKAMKLGAYDYLTKPVDVDDLLALLRQCLSRGDGSRGDEAAVAEARVGLEKIVGESAEMMAVFSHIRRAARSDSTILILGESGTGKELVAEAVHVNSFRKNGSFVAVNMAAVPAALVESELFGHVKGSFTGASSNRMGKFQAANGGTIFIDEIGDFAIESQSKLLRVLETRTITPVGGNDEQAVDVRVVAATSRNLEQMVSTGQFREDLYYRLSVVTLSLPPLRDRLDDVPMLTKHFLQQLARANNRPAFSVDPELMKFLETFPWPGNVRQLRNCLESMVVMSDKPLLELSDLPPTLVQPASRKASNLKIPAGVTMENLERVAVLQALERCQGNRTRAAESLGISVRTLQRRLGSWGLADTPHKSE